MKREKVNPVCLRRVFLFVVVLTAVFCILGSGLALAQSSGSLWPDGCSIPGGPQWMKSGVDMIFLGACTRHDYCYGECNPQGGPYFGYGHKEGCDATLAVELDTACSVEAAALTFPLDDIPDANTFLKICAGLAATFVAAVNTPPAFSYFSSDQCFYGCNADFCGGQPNLSFPCYWRCGWVDTSGGGGDPGGGIKIYCDPNSGLCSPIVVDVAGNGYGLTDLAHGVAFNLTGKGSEMVSWTDPKHGNAWLALDRNGNGTIDDGTELFGTFTPQPVFKGIPPNGFLALAVYDQPENGGNGNGIIDPGDAIWSKLRLWIDSNQNGFSEPWELHTLSEFGISGIDLNYRLTRRRDRYGNVFRYRSEIIDSDGRRARGRTIWDVGLLTQY